MKRAEFVVIATLLMALAALSVDTVLPALSDIARTFGVEDGNRRQWTLTALFVGIAVGQLLYGPLSDAIGRKPAILIGLVWFVVGSILSAGAQSFEAMLAGRVLQGFGAASPRIVTVAMVRDRFEGTAMAQVMSVLISVFILVPVLAPSLGQVVIWHASWRVLFLVVMAIGIAAGLWFALRQEETLAVRRPFEARLLFRAAVEVMRNRRTVSFTLAGACCYGAMMSYIATSQQIFQDIYRVGDLFPFYFGACAAFIALATMVNAVMVARLGMERICVVAIGALGLWSAVVLAATLAGDGTLPLWLWLAFTAVAMFALGLVFGNLNAVALQPLGHIAGVASSITASMTTVISLVIAAIVGNLLDGTVTPILVGWVVMGALGSALLAFGRRPPRQPAGDAPAKRPA